PSGDLEIVGSEDFGYIRKIRQEIDELLDTAGESFRHRDYAVIVSKSFGFGELVHAACVESIGGSDAVNGIEQLSLCLRGRIGLNEPLLADGEIVESFLQSLFFSRNQSRKIAHRL